MKDFFEWLKTATWTKVLIGAVSGSLLIIGYTVWENRQRVYDRVWQPVAKGDWPLQPPGEAGKALLADFSKRYPNVAMIAVVDADPIANTRQAVYRHFNNKALERVIADAEQNGKAPRGLLYGVDSDSNRLTLAVLNAQVLCEDATKGFFAKTYPESAAMLVTSCRTPLPPIYGMTTGWLSLHFTTKVSETPELTMDLLNLAQSYYKAEILPLQK